MGRNPRYDSLVAKMTALHESKSHDYAEGDNPFSNFEFAAQFAGVTVDQVFDVLIGVKQARLQVLSKAGAPNFESLYDTRIDQANYAALKAAYHEDDVCASAKRCGVAGPLWTCSQPAGHTGPHVARLDHDPNCEVLEMWS